MFRRGRGRRVYLVAPAGFPNWGDELIARAWLTHLADAWPAAEVILDCHTPGTTTLLHGGTHPNLTVTDTLFRLAGDPGAESRLTAGLALLESATDIHLLGGGWVNDLWPHHAAIVEKAAEVARETGARLVATGQGLVPGAGIAPRLAGAWGEFELVDVRDAASCALLPPGVRASVSGDDAWLAEIGDGPRWARDRGFVVCVQSDLLDDAKGDPLDHVTRQLAAWGARGDEVVVLECIPGVDAAGLAAGALTLGFEELWAEGLPARPGQRWLTTRYHPHLVAASRGASGVALDAHVGGYYSAKHAAVGAVGSRWPVVVPGQLADAGPGMRARNVEVARRAKWPLARSLYPVSRGAARRR